MQLIDSHTHLYLPEFNSDIDKVIQNAIEKGIFRMILPNIDSSSFLPMMQVCRNYHEHCLPAIGLHPTSVKENYKEELEFIIKTLSEEKFTAVGEVGIDLYWDKTFLKQQKEVFSIQVDLAQSYDLPLIIHCRESFREITEILDRKKIAKYKGVFHSFSGTLEQAEKIIGLGFKIGINGIVTYKNSNLSTVLNYAGIENILLETDSPYLTPVPYRGKRNESSYLIYIAQKVSEILNISLEEVAAKTTENAIQLFSLNTME